MKRSSLVYHVARLAIFLKICYKFSTLPTNGSERSTRLSLIVVQQFNDALTMLECLCTDAAQTSQNPAVNAIPTHLRAALMQGLDPNDARQVFFLEPDALQHPSGRIRGSTRYLPFTFARWQRFGQVFNMDVDRVVAAPYLTSPFGNVRLPFETFALSIPSFTTDALGTPFSLVVVDVERFGEHRSCTLTAFADHLAHIHTHHYNIWKPNDWVRSVTLDEAMLQESPAELMQSLIFEYRHWPWMSQQIANFWMAWLIAIERLTEVFHTTPSVSPPVQPVLLTSPRPPSLPPLPPEPIPAFAVEERTYVVPDPTAMPASIPDAPDPIEREPRQGREQRPRTCAPYSRRRRGTGHDPLAPKFPVKGYRTKRNLDDGARVIGSAVKVEE